MKPDKRKTLFAVSALVLSFLLSIGTLEIVLRVLHSDEIRKLQFARRFGLGEIRNIEQDPRLGWRTRPGSILQGQSRDCVGEIANYRNAIDSAGFRFRADPNRPPDLLMLGDSMLQADGVDDSETFPALLARQSGLNIWAYGCKGYGTTQEWLWLQENLARIKPRMVLLLFCPNDFINNSPAWERVDKANNNLRPRPYLMPDGSISIIDPSPPEYNLAYRLEIGRTVANFLNRWQASSLSKTNSADIQAFLNQSKSITSKALQNIQALCDAQNALLFTFFTHEQATPDAFETAFEELARSLKLQRIAGISLSIDQACRSANAPVAYLDAPDGHWNQTGHRLIADQLNKLWLEPMRAAGDKAAP